MMTIDLRSIPRLSITLLLTTLALFLISTTVAHAQVTPGDPGNFITTWDTENPGTSNDDQITIPGVGGGGGYSYAVYWESLTDPTATGTVATTTSISTTITFPEPGQYQVEITGDFPRIFFNNGGDKDKILTVEQWGSIAWESMARAFWGATNLTVPATDAPDLSNVTSMFSMFRLAASFNDPVNHWDVSNVTDMGGVFMGTNFDQEVNSWDVSNVTDMWSVFHSSSFDQPLNNWNVSKVQNMHGLFNATPFNQDISMWNTASVTTMFGMFRNNSAFDQNLADWNIENVTDMEFIFANSVGLSQANLDATLVGWAAQSLQDDVPFHLGLKTYSDVGATALNTLRDTYNWDITEQYQALYAPGTKASLIGEGTQAPINNGSSTDAVEVRTDDSCNFVEWSDGVTSNPRTDVLTDNLTVSAVVSCSSNTSTSARTQRDKAQGFGNEGQAREIEERFPDAFNDDNTPKDLSDTLEDVRQFIDTDLPPVDPIRDRDIIVELIATLLELIEALTKLLMMMKEA